MEVDPFTLYEKVPNKGICEINYVGARFLKLNQTSGHECFLNSRTTNMCLAHPSFNTFARNNCEETKSKTEMVQIKDGSTYLVIYCFKNQIKTGALSGPCPNYPFRWSKEKNFSIDEFSYEGRSLQIREKLDYAQGIDHQIQLALPSYTVKETTKESDTNQQSESSHLIMSILIGTVITSNLLYLIISIFRARTRSPPPEKQEENTESKEYLRLTRRD